MKKIAIITTYHGKFPNTIEFWLKSIEFNPTIDFFLFTDLEVQNVSSNLHVVRKSFEELVEMAQKQFDFPVAISRPYKYPDFRPAFGEIFSEYLNGYDFWGFSEQDLIYGDIRAFITDDILNKYDKILGNGHLTLYRNNPSVNSTYKMVDKPDYRFVYTHSRNFYFEEYYGTSGWWVRNRPELTYKDVYFDDINYFKRHFVPNHGVASGEKNIIYSFENGKVYRLSQKGKELLKTEVLYVHFQKRPMQIKTKVQNEWMMIPDAFIPFESEVTISTLSKYGHSRFSYGKKYWTLQWKRVVVKFWKIVYPSVLDK